MSTAPSSPKPSPLSWTGPVAEPYAEVIGDPVGHSLSPAIHGAWLAELGLTGTYQATRVAAGDLASFLAERRRDPDWQGCNATAPHKQNLIPLLDELDMGAREVGAVNCVVPRSGRLLGHNSDVDGVVWALSGGDLRGRSAAVVGAGGAARAAVVALRGLGVAEVRVVARRPDAIEDLEVVPFDNAARAFEGAAAIINATPLGLAGGHRMPDEILAALPAAARDATVLDMVYAPRETLLLRAAAGCGLRAVDGTAMLIGQARRAFELFFGVPAPQTEPDLREPARAG